MKMKLYYVVKKANGFYDEHDFDYVQVKHTCGKIYFVQIKNCQDAV